MNKVKIFLCLVTLPIASAFGTVTLQLNFGDFYSSDGVFATPGSKAILVVDAGQNGFVGDYLTATADYSGFAGTTLAEGNLIGGSGDDEIVYAGDIVDDSGITGIADSITFNLDGGIDQGDELGLYWFPTVSTGSISGAVDEYGFFRSDSPSTVIDNSIAFVVPPDGTFSLAALTPSATSQSSLTNGDLTAIPEPSSYATIVGLLGLAYAVSRRRRRSSSLASS